MTPEMQQIADDFELFDDWEDRYAYLIEQGRKLLPMADTCKTEENRVRGCTSQVWFIAEERGDRLEFIADSDAHLVKGLIALLLKVYSGQTREHIRKTDILPLFESIGLKSHLSPSRSNGFFAMVKRIKEMAA